MTKSLSLVMFVLLMGHSIISAQIYDPETTESSETELSITTNSDVTSQMMEPNQDLRKNDILLDAKGSGKIKDKSLSIGFSIIGIADYQKSNTNSKFAYLMRHPTANNQIGFTASEAVIHSAQVSLLSSLNSWLTVYGELLYSPEQSFGTGTITSLGRNQIEFRKGMIMIGNPEKCPLYLALGKMDAPFGQMGSVSPFTNSTMWHAFGGLGYGAILGFRKYGLNISIAPTQGGSQFRALNVPVDSTAIPSRINNLVLDLNYTLQINDNISVKAGASWLKGSAYCHGFPIVHFEPCADNNPAFTYYGMINVGDRLTLKGSFAKTNDVWPGTFNPNSPLDVFEASKVSSLDYGARYQINKHGKFIFSASGEFSNFVAGPEGAPWERQTQIVIGLNAQVEKTSRLFIEYFKTAGYVPLNFASGGNFPNLGITHSVNDASSFGFVAGVLYAI